MKLTIFQIIATLAAGFAAASAQASAQKTKEMLYVQSTLTRDIQVVDAETFEVTDTIYVGDLTDDVIGAPDGRMVYANAQIANGNPFSHQANHAGKIVAYDTADHELVWSVALDGSPHHLALSPEGDRLFVPLYDRHYYVVIDTASGAVIARPHSMAGNHGAKVSKDGSKLIFGNMVTDAFVIHDAKTGAPLNVIDVEEGVRPYVFSKDESIVYYQLSRLHGFEVRNMKTGELIRRVDLPALPADVDLPTSYPHTYNHGLARTSDERLLLAAGSAGNYVAVYALPDLELKATIPVGVDPNWIVVRADDKIAFVSNRGSDDLSVLDLETLREVKRVPLGDLPQRMNLVDVPVSRAR